MYVGGGFDGQGNLFAMYIGRTQDEERRRADHPVHCVRLPRTVLFPCVSHLLASLEVYTLYCLIFFNLMFSAPDMEFR